MSNDLYPIFLKTEQFNILIVGGGKVALEKLSFLLKSSPNSKVTVVSKHFHADILAMSVHENIILKQEEYTVNYLKSISLVIVATNDTEENIRVYRDAKANNILVNVADNPMYCDFYMGGIVTKGDLKLGISTNGKSPTLAKRLRQFFEQVLPEELDDLLDNLNQYRKTIKGDFDKKVEQLNKATELLIK
ncbi:MAG: bifunctional precorrin-2 dehydrogenase/sirohydrochlorin ferrochelatase [Crocinitomicaceae bacterium]|nr:bifunctional precorrin-2 dehydrogenase/sirohydrochlorin ferrochelatase [Flavobacteriales bacterium]NQZ34858.1 bifunctional precorrin-2 dehydrogenase/sirohydrochlorin ferrochelatase [Crocinitomicaceae bacterium]